MCRIFTIPEIPGRCRGQSIDPAFLTDEFYQKEPYALMRTSDVPHCIGFSEEANLQDDAHDNVQQCYNR